MRSWETIATCNHCKTQKIKRKSEYNSKTYLCVHCFRKMRGKVLGEKYGKKQQLQGRCANCDISIPSSLTWCKDSICQKERKRRFKWRMKGENNPVWKGNSICKCGKKKDIYAKKCRSCSFASGDRSGANNGRYVSKNRSEFLANQKSRKIARNILSNYLKAKGLKKTFKSEKTLRYSFEEFKSHIESQFENWMNWENYGLGENKWNIDHIVPITVLNDLGITLPHQVNALVNLRPMDSIDNIKKSNKLEAGWQEIVDSINQLDT